MAKNSPSYAIIFDPESGFQLLNTATNEVADMAVLEGSWRKQGAEVHRGKVSGDAVTPQGIGDTSGTGTAMLKYGSLRIRSTGRTSYDIADPRVSLRDEHAEDA